MGKISVVIIAFNEEKRIKKTLDSVSFADEIIFVDTESTDATVDIAKKFTKKVFTHKNVGYVEPVRTFAISKASNEWILLLDADEQIPKELADQLLEISNGG